MRSVYGTRSDRDGKETEAQRSIPDTVKFISDPKIQKFDRSSRCRHASMIKLNDIYAARVRCTPRPGFQGSFIINSLFLWGRWFYGLKE